MTFEILALFNHVRETRYLTCLRFFFFFFCKKYLANQSEFNSYNSFSLVSFKIVLFQVNSDDDDIQHISFLNELFSTESVVLRKIFEKIYKLTQRQSKVN